MRNLIRKILKEENEEKNQIDIGDIFYIPKTKVLIRITDINCSGVPRMKEHNTTDWGKQEIYYDGCDLKYEVSRDKGVTWEYEEEDGHWVEVSWIQNIVEKGYWELLQKDIDFFDQLNENEEDELEWAQEIVNEPLINVGDVFYIVDQGSDVNTQPNNYYPRHARYVFYIEDIKHGEIMKEDGYEDTIFIKHTLCDPGDTTYNKKDYHRDSPKCRDYEDEDTELIGYTRALDLITSKYWRKMN